MPAQSGPVLPPTETEERVARSVLDHIRSSGAGWYGRSRMIEPYETMAVTKLALAIRAALEEESQ